MAKNAGSPKVKQVATSLAAFVIALLVVELLCRWVVEGRIVKTVEIPHDDTPIRRDEHVGFVLVPGDRDGTHINQLGLRGPEIDLEKKPGCLRILMIGGSTTFGNTVSTEEAYPTVVERLLRERDPGGCVEVVNAGISGAHSYHHLVRYQRIYSQLKPDLVTLYVGWNDYGTYFWQRERWKPESLAADSLVVEVGPLALALLRNSSLSRVTYSAYSRAMFIRSLRDLAASPDVAADLARPTQALHHNLERLIDLARQDGAEVLLIKFPFVLHDERVATEIEQIESMDVPGRIKDMIPMVRFEPSLPVLVAKVYDDLATAPGGHGVQGAQGVRTVDCRRAFRSMPIEDRIMLFDDVIHPNAQGYRLIGQCVADAIADPIADAIADGTAEIERTP